MFALPGIIFAPVEYAESQAAADCGGKTCDQTHTYKEMKIAMDHANEAELHYEEVKETCLGYQTTLTTTAAAEQYEYYHSIVEPCNDDMAEAEFELHHANHTQHSAALSFRAEQNIFNAETYLVDHMYEIVQRMQHVCIGCVKVVNGCTQLTRVLTNIIKRRDLEP